MGLQGSLAPLGPSSDPSKSSDSCNPAVLPPAATVPSSGRWRHPRIPPDLTRGAAGMPARVVTPPGIAGISDDISGRIHIRDQAVPPQPHMKRRLPRSTRGPGLPGDPVPAGLPGMAAHGPSPASAPAPPVPAGGRPPAAAPAPRPAGARGHSYNPGDICEYPILPPRDRARYAGPPRAAIAAIPRGDRAPPPGAAAPASRAIPVPPRPPPARSRCRRPQVPRRIPWPPADAPPEGPAAPRGSRARRTGPPRVFQGAGGPGPCTPGPPRPGP